MTRMGEDQLSYFCQVISPLPFFWQHPQDALQLLPLCSILDERKRLFACQFEQLLVAQRICDVKAQIPRLPRAKEFTRPAKQEISFCNFEAIRRAHHSLEAGASFIRHTEWRDQNAVRLL